MSFRGLDGKVVVVTGGGSGIGAASARRLAEEGARVVVVDSAGERAEEVAGALPDALAVASDVSDEAGVDEYMRLALERFGAIDHYHLNAGISGEPVAFPDVSLADYEQVQAVNVRGVFLGLRAAFRRYAEQ
ncbi:MAG TPA: SDR family NAD(P)-dependent oxidoreductase, partial [Gaiellaceae bacterium]